MAKVLAQIFRCRHADAIAGPRMVSADHFAHELRTQLRSAADQGGTTIVITSGELCKNIRMGSSSTQACCEAMLAEVKPGDVVLVSSSGAETIIRYRLPRTAQ
jgi:UDP-N-acetylmuramyl pentapeptide synthase